jgi:quinol---cytochrome c reductase iron-sulfur subunit
MDRDEGAMIALAFLLSAAASAGLTVVYALGGQPQIEGALLAIALGGLAAGLIGWARAFLPHGPFVQSREEVMTKPVAEAEAEESFKTGAEQIERRGVLAGLLALAAAALGGAAVFPIRSLGARPGRSLFNTAWTKGARMVTSTGEVVKAEKVALNTVLTVFPEGHEGRADSQTLLLRLPDGLYEPPPGREDWSPSGFVAFSKVCTHAGCPVGLYAAESHELFCPCHQSVFDVLKAATPTSGPATRPLPQLAVAIDHEGFLVAQDDYDEPIGPGFWSRSRA